MVKRFLTLLLAVCLCLPIVHAAEVRVTANAAIVMEAGTGRVLFEQNAHARLPFASTTKIMTALLSLEQPGVDVEFEVDANAIKVEGSSMGLVEGDRVTLRTLAAGMLLPSGNDAANAAAVRIAGSLPQFAHEMNDRAREIGMTNTSFETPSGLDGEHHYSTAYDLALLAREALRNPDFMDICSQYRMRVSFGNPPYERWLVNHNRLLNYYEHTTGMKTGFTRRAGRCLVTTAQKDGVTLIVVTLNSPDDWNTHENLYERFFPYFQSADIAAEVGRLYIPVTGGAQENLPLMIKNSFTVALPVDGDYNMSYKLSSPRFLYAPIEAGHLVGHIDITLDDQHIATLDLVAAKDIPLLHPYEPKQVTIFTRIKQALDNIFARFN